MSVQGSFTQLRCVVYRWSIPMDFSFPANISYVQSSPGVTVDINVIPHALLDTLCMRFDCTAEKELQEILNV